MSNPEMRHIFISYTRKDAELVAKLKADLDAAGVKYWIDKEDLKAGMPNWEKAIRLAIREARLVLYVASPVALDSEYVQDELSIAKMEGCPILPVWVSGERWMESAPMGMGRMQYVDLRGAQYAQELPRLIGALLAGGAALAQKLQPEAVDSTQTRAIPSGDPRNPYKALDAFTSADRGDFFGRDDLIAALVERLTSYPPLLALVGASGAGKSSVMMAGLLPKLSESAIAGSDKWIYLPALKPDKHPVEGLAVALSAVLKERSINSIMEDLQAKHTRGMFQLASSITRPPKARVVLLLDQFEELFTQCDDLAERDQFIHLLTTALAEPSSPLTVLITLRADFFDRPLQYAEFGKLLNAHVEPILPMSLRDLQAVIEQPAALPDVQISFEAGLVSELVFETRDEVGGLPLLQFTLDLLFQHRSGRQLTWAAYRNEIGGLRGALRTHAEQTYQALPSDDARKLAKALFLRLIEPGATEQDTTRRRAPQRELVGADAAQTAQMQAVAASFVGARLLTADTSTIEVSHEALIREWTRLGEWLRESRDDLRLQRDLSSDAAEWQRRGQPADRLYRGLVLDEALLWQARNVPSADESAFLAAGVSDRARQADDERTRQSRELDLARRAEAAERDRATRFQRAARIAALIATVAVLGVVGAIVGIFSAVQQTASAALDRAQLETLVPGLGQVPPPVNPTLALESRLATMTQVANLYRYPMTTPSAKIDGVEMVLVPAGCFWMGSAINTDEQPVHQVCFDRPYWLDKYEVTSALYTQFIADGGYETEGYWTTAGWEWMNAGNYRPRNFVLELIEMQRPAVGLTWYEAYAYCASRKARLPTEAEWEYAARGPDSLQYPWGSKDIPANSVNASNANGKSANVGSKPAGASWVGAQDLAGNVWEWTATQYDQEKFPYPYREGDGRNSSDGTNTLVLRGGSWVNVNGPDLRAANRSGNVPSFQNGSYGFRCARS